MAIVVLLPAPLPPSRPVIEPGADSVEFGGRVGARFRTPDPRRYASQLVLADPSALHDLQATPIDEIIDFLAELGPRRAELLAARAPKLRTAVRDAVRAGYAYVVLDGTLIPVDRVAADRPFFSGKHHCHGMNLQVISGPAGQLVWVSGALPGSVHDMKAAWIWGIEDELAAADLPALAGQG